MFCIFIILLYMLIGILHSFIFFTEIICSIISIMFSTTSYAFHFFLLLLLTTIQTKNTIVSVFNVDTNHVVLTVSNSDLSCTFFTMNIFTGVVKHFFYAFSPVNIGIELDFTKIRTINVKVKQFVGYNNANNNAYLITDSVKCSLEQNNFTMSSYVEIFAVNKIITAFGDSVNEFYELIQSGTNFAIKNCIKDTTNFVCTQILSFQNQNAIQMKYERSRLFLLTTLSTNSSAGIIRVYSNFHSLIIKLPIVLTNPNLSFLCVNSRYFAIITGLSATVYEIISNYSILSTFTIAGTQISDVQLSDYTVLVTVDSKIQQYSVFNGMLFVSSTTIYSTPLMKISVVLGASFLVLWKPGNTFFLFYQFNQNYDYIGLPCMNFYCINPITNQCQFCGIIPLPPLPTMPPTNNLQASSCFTASSLYCQIYCVYPCATCLESQFKCESCIQHYIFKDGNCYLQNQIQALLALISLVNIFRFNNAQRVYFFVGNLQLYNYHQTSYDGIIKQVLDFMDFIDDQLWILMPSKALLAWSQQPFNLPNYNVYTNSKFLEKQHKDTLFSQTTKSYSTIYFPAVVGLFIVFNRLFYCTFNYKFSSILRIFSFWLHLAVIVFVQNIQSLTFLALRDFQNMFSLNNKVYLAKGATVLFYGLTFTTGLCVYFLSNYLYGSLSKYFLSNCYRLKYAFMLTTMRLVMKPIIESIIHGILYQSPTTQVLTLAMINLVSLFVLWIFEQKTQMFIIKVVFACECVFQFNMMLLNLSIFAKYYTEGQQDIKDLVESVLAIIMHIFIMISAIGYFGAVFFFIKSTFCNLQHQDSEDETEICGKESKNLKKKQSTLLARSQQIEQQNYEKKEKKTKNSKTILMVQSKSCEQAIIKHKPKTETKIGRSGRKTRKFHIKNTIQYHPR